MVFTDPRFVPFLVAVLVLYWSFRSDQWRKPILLAASYAFYCAWDWRFTGLLLASTLIDWWIGLRIAADEAPAHKRRWLLISIVANLTFLGVFKYFNFFVGSAVALLERAGVPVSRPAFEVILPVGISFYTFMSLGYTIDVYRGRLPPRRSLLDYAVFVSFFPHLVAGPILRAVDFLKQLDAPREWNRSFPVRTALTLLLLGFVKKSCIADNLAPIVERVFDRPEIFSTADQWLAAALYHAQIYCDFSGYTDIALGCAGLLGYTLCPNFDYPYFSSNMAEFWRRWHMSLSSWFKDYLYVPLGGNRRGPARTTVNLFIVLVLCGLWHGADWKFVLWGFIHGVYVTTVYWYGRLVPERNPVARAIHVLGPVLTNVAMILSWVAFRAVDWPRLGTMYARMFGAGPPATHQLDQVWWLVFAALAMGHWLAYRGAFAALGRKISGTSWWFAYGSGWAAVLPLAAASYQPFVYFQF